MAEKRMLSKCISISERVNELPEIFDMLLFTWLIPHTDDFGRLTGSPAKVKALVVPMLDKSAKDVENSLIHLHNAELIIWYECNGDKYIQIVNFEKHQQGLHKRTKSKFPEPPVNPFEIPDDSRNFPEIPPEQNRTELNRTEENGTELEKEKSLRVVARLFESEGFGTISVTIRDKLCELLDDYGERWVVDAMKLSVVKGKRKLSFTEGVLKNWKADGRDETRGISVVSPLPTLAEVRAEEERKKKERQEGLRREMFGDVMDGAG